MSHQPSLWTTRPSICFFDLSRGARAAFSARTPKAMLYFARTYDIPIISDPADLVHFTTVLFSLHSFRDFYRVADISHHKQPHQEWIAGGNAAATPTGVLWIMDHVWLGDCRASFPLILRGARDLPGMLHAADPCPTPYIDEDIAPEALSSVELEMSKGCPRRCLFCIHPWRHRYQEQPRALVEDFIRTRKGKGLGLVSNSSSDVSYYEALTQQLDAQGKTDMIVSNAIQGLTPQMVATRKREVLLGIEGMSARLRQIINKPIRRTTYHEKLDLLFTAGVQVRTVYQFNLPGESAADFDELTADVAAVRARHPHGSWAIPFIPNQPSAHTPLQWHTPHYDLDMFHRIMTFRTEQFGSGTRGISLYVPAPLGAAHWFAQVIAEWIPITPAVARAVTRIPNADVPTMTAALAARDVHLPPAFLHRHPDTTFPWSLVQMPGGDDPNIHARFLHMHDRIQRLPQSPVDAG
jgi:hypothetical protein